MNTIPWLIKTCTNTAGDFLFFFRSTSEKKRSTLVREFGNLLRVHPSICFQSSDQVDTTASHFSICKVSRYPMDRIKSRPPPSPTQHHSLSLNSLHALSIASKGLLSCGSSFLPFILPLPWSTPQAVVTNFQHTDMRIQANRFSDITTQKAASFRTPQTKQIVALKKNMLTHIYRRPCLNTL